MEVEILNYPKLQVLKRTFNKWQIRFGFLNLKHYLESLIGYNKIRNLEEGVQMMGEEENGFLTVPFMIDTGSFPQPTIDIIRSAMAEMSKDLGCVKLKEVPQSASSPYSQGKFILISFKIRSP